MAQTKIMKLDLESSIQTQMTDLTNSLSFTPNTSIGQKTSAYTYANLKDRLNNLETLLSNVDAQSLTDSLTYTNVSSVQTKTSGHVYGSLSDRFNELESIANTAFEATTDVSNAKTFETNASAETKSNGFSYASLDARLNNIESLINYAYSEVSVVRSYDSSVSVDPSGSASHASLAARLNFLEKMSRSSYLDTSTNYKTYSAPAGIYTSTFNYTSAVDRLNTIERIAKASYTASVGANVGVASDNMDFHLLATLHAKLNFLNQTEAGTFTEVIAYDSDGNVTSLTIKNSDNITISITTFTYSSGNLTGSTKVLKYPSNGVTYRTIYKSYTYDANGNVTQITTTTA